jgi:hypothetical protein
MRLTDTTDFHYIFTLHRGNGTGSPRYTLNTFIPIARHNPREAMMSLVVCLPFIHFRGECFSRCLCPTLHITNWISQAGSLSALLYSRKWPSILFGFTPFFALAKSGGERTKSDTRPDSFPDKIPVNRYPTHFPISR